MTHFGDRQIQNIIFHLGACNYSPSAFILRELKLHQSKHGVEAKLDQSQVPTEWLESFNGKYQLLDGGPNKLITKKPIL